MSQPQQSNTPNPLTLILLNARQALYVAGFFSCVINCLMLVAPLYMIQVFDRVLSGRSYDTLIYLTLIAVTATALLGLLIFIRSQVLVIIGNWTERTLTPPVIEVGFDRHLIGSAYSTQAIRDVHTLKQFIVGPGMTNMFDLPWVPIFIFTLFMLHSYLGLYALTGATTLFGLTVALELLTRDLTREATAQGNENQRRIESAFRNADVVQAMGMMPPILERWSTKNSDASSLANQSSDRTNALQAFVRFIRLSMQLGILALGAYLAISGDISSGVMIGGSIILGRALAPIDQAITTWKQWVQARHAYSRLKAQLAIPSFRPERISMPPFEGHLSVEGVAFRYPKSPKATIQQINFKASPGEVLAILGPSAAGKSTLARLVVGALPATMGAVRLDGMEIYRCDRQHFGRYVGYLPQDIELFSDTIKSNIARLGEIDDDAVIDAAKTAGVHEMILRLPNGYEMEVGEGGEILSGGQRQRIGLARALYRKPKLIVLDEPNSNLDHLGETALIQAIAAAKGWGATVIVIAQRPSIIGTADKIIVVQDGAICEQGDRDAVLQRMGLKTK